VSDFKILCLLLLGRLYKKKGLLRFQQTENSQLILTIMWGQIIRYFWIRRNILLCHTILLCHYTSLVNECAIDSFPNASNSVFLFIWNRRELCFKQIGRLIAWLWSWIRLYFKERSVRSSPPHCRFLSGMAVVAQEAGQDGAAVRKGSGNQNRL